MKATAIPALPMVRQLLLLLMVVTATPIQALKFGLVNGDSDFFTPVVEGWFNQCEKLGAECLFHKPDYTNCTTDTIPECLARFAPLFQDWLAQGVQGIAIKPSNYINGLVDDMIADLNLPVVTFDSTHPNTSAYIGTDQEFLGRTMARLLRQLRPEGGTYAMVARKSVRDAAFVQEIERYNNRDDRAHWHEIPTNYTLAENVYATSALKSSGGFIGLMERAALLNPTAMIFFKQSPMREENYTQFVQANQYRGITYIGTDGADYQLSYLSRRYVDGLVGQLPYEFGTHSAQALYDILTTGKPESEIISTNIVAYNLIPLELPQLDVDDNLLDGLVIMGYVCFGLIFFSVMICVAWTHLNQSKVVVRSAQPFFLHMISTGVLILSSSIIPLSFDDGGDLQPESHTWSVGVCMSVPWLAFLGFTITFSALFSKTWRVNQIFRAKETYTRIRLSKFDVLAPFAFLLFCNILILTLWTILDPLEYIRQEHDGTDYWNRVLSTYGACRSDTSVAYLVPLAALNFLVVVISCWQALEAKDIQSEFSESKYIGLAVASLFQGFLTGIPVIVVVRDEPKAYYLIVTLMIFLLSMVLLWLIFLPKIMMQRKYSKMTPQQQRDFLQRDIKPESSANQSSGVVGYRSRNDASVGDGDSDGDGEVDETDDDVLPTTGTPETPSTDTGLPSNVVVPDDPQLNDQVGRHTDKTVAFVGGPPAVSEITRIKGLTSVEDVEGDQKISSVEQSEASQQHPSDVKDTNASKESSAWNSTGNQNSQEESTFDESPETPQESPEPESEALMDEAEA
mmetsp:Transcript_30664/g.64052  ORF Transcript_30664/g.64052 Transcript_30664/m.64052 type:complete len:796 (-) Transcript_30664:641-3028(-)|eukprot:CAMPEP_0172441536 /NCGR_PEP_ID=MMETSP1065-20121228/2090_1 /TAXON_ID=265537 /ORGANISM="Amphiprora paludosa, Strain CCMP125" /LENGTH=795 /DNA_ID=CAMNT_0013190981 /DNA_START=102 /DNA_END=2489 /DNA_ORIENTATION=+